MGQRAKLSDLQDWTKANPDRMASSELEQTFSRLAEREARAILAETEPRQEQGMSGHWPCGRPNQAWQAERLCYDESGYLSGTGWMAHAALAESLAAFCEE